MGVDGVLTQELVPLGFRRRGRSWYRTRCPVYAVVSLQRSSWGSSVYVNVGFSPVEQADRGWIPESKCQVRFRVDAVRAVSAAGLTLLDDAAAGQEERVGREVIAPLVEILQRVVDLESLGQVIRFDLSAKVMIHRDIRARIGLSAS
jgi:hypothetical protein